MHFDDRLATVLDQAASGPHDRAVQWRQLVDLVARAPSVDDPLVVRALDRIAEGRSEIDEPLRASAARSIAGLPLNAELVALFGADRATVAAPVLVAAQLPEAGWRRVWAAASAETRALIEAARPDAVALLRPVAAVAEPVGASAGDGPSIGELVARIERLRHARPGQPERAGAALAEPPRTAAPSTLPLFRWECGPSGEIEWVEGAPRGALVGRSLAGVAEDGAADPAVGRALAARAPFRDAVLTVAGEGQAAGAWRITGVPEFDPADGRFHGYHGIAWRDPPAARSVGAGARTLPRDGDALRELVHEIRTPLNAIIGFAEIIDGQYLGPAHRGYRDRAADIVRQARHLLDAVEDLDLAAKLNSSRAISGEGTEFAELFPRLAEEFGRYAAARNAGILLTLEGSLDRCTLDPALAERLVRRFVESLIDIAGPSETLALDVGSADGMCAVTLTRPHAIRGTTDAQLFDPAFAPDTEGKLGIGFALRLVRGLAQIAGGDLRVDPEKLVLLVPAVQSAD